MYVEILCDISRMIFILFTGIIFRGDLMFLVYLLIVESQGANAAAVRDLSDNHKKSAFFEGRFMSFSGSSSVLLL